MQSKRRRSKQVNQTILTNFHLYLFFLIILRNIQNKNKYNFDLPKGQNRSNLFPETSFEVYDQSIFSTRKIEKFKLYTILTFLNISLKRL